MAEVAEVAESFLQERDLISVQCTVPGCQGAGNGLGVLVCSKHFNKLLPEERLAYISGASLNDREQPGGTMFTFE